MAITIQSILQQHLDDYFARHAWHSHVRRAAERMRDCRTAALGGHVERCPNGHVQKVHYNSCHHRSCPQCNGLPRERWLDGWKGRLLQTDHRHVVFTVSDELNLFWQYNRVVFSQLFFSSVRETLSELLEDKKYLGGRPGMLASLHTWGQMLQTHLHVHVLVTGGGLGPDGGVSGDGVAAGWPTSAGGVSSWAHARPGAKHRSTAATAEPPITVCAPSTSIDLAGGRVSCPGGAL